MIRSIPAWNRSVLLLVVAVAAYFQTWTDLWPYWENKDATYTHGTLIALIALWLVWRTRSALSDAPSAGSLPALAMVLVLSAIWLIAARANAFIVHAALWPVLAFAIVWAGVGSRAAAKLAFPLSFLYFAIPIWDYLKPPLQTITSGVVGYLTGIAGLPASVNGPYITLPEGTIYIALDCSGAHFLCVALAVGVLAGVMRGDALRTRLLILGVAALLSMVFNWLRILLIVFAYLHPDLQQTLENIGHFTFGWWVFAFDLLVFALVLRFVPTSRPRERRSGVVAGEAQGSSGAYRFALTLVASLLLPVSVWALPRSDSYAGKPRTPLLLPSTIGQTSPDSRWQPEFDGAAWEERTAYLTTDGGALELYTNGYHRQTQGKELISRGSPLFDAVSFATHSSTEITLSSAAGSTIEARRVELVDQYTSHWIAVYTYLVDQDTMTSTRRVQLTTAFRSLYRRTTAGVLALAAPCAPPDCAIVGARLEQALVQAHDAYLTAPREPGERSKPQS